MSEYEKVDWKKANCVDMPTSMFYKIEEDRNKHKLIDMDYFRMICTACPIWKECLKYAANNERYGVWGGMNTQERQAFSSHSRSDLRKKILEDFKHYGIDSVQIEEAINGDQK